MEWPFFPSVIIPQNPHFGWTSFRGECLLLLSDSVHANC